MKTKERDAALGREKALREKAEEARDFIFGAVPCGCRNEDEPCERCLLVDEINALLRSPPEPVRGPDVRKEVEG